MKKIALAKIEVRTTEYKMIHGKLPSGTGHWGFEFQGFQHDKIIHQLWFAPVAMSFSEAKKLAKLEAQKYGVDIMVLCP